MSSDQGQSPSQSQRSVHADIAGHCQSDLADQLTPLTDKLKALYGASLCATVFYGSCLRTGELHEGLIDFYVVVDSYRSAHQSNLSAALNWLIPPNVYYLEVATPQGTLRSKYAVLSIKQLEDGAKTWFQSGIWGRFAQPLAIVYARDEAQHLRVRAACGQSVVTLLCNALPVLPEELDSYAAFSQALALSYGSELRVESKARGGDLIAENIQEFERRWRLTLPLLALAHDSVNEPQSSTVRFNIAQRQRRFSAIAWSLRRVQGKILSVLRLVKACFTFAGAIDYAAWKLERHTGEKINVTPRLRRYPLIFGWGILWRLLIRRRLR